jgi:hypothetical protein
MMALGRLCSRDIPIKRYIVRGVSEGHPGLFRPKDARKALSFKRVITSNDVLAQDKLVARLRYRGGLFVNRWKFVLLVKSAIV